MPPKKPFKLPRFSKKQQSQEQSSSTSSTPTTASEFLDAGISEEELGDRRILSDLSKTLRAYQRAHEMYIRAMAMDSELIDAWYNDLRLIYHVYESFKKVPRTYIDDCGGVDVFMPLSDVKRRYDEVLMRFGGWVNWEFGYNLILINIGMIEENQVERGNSFERMMDDTMKLVNQVVEFQMKELDEFLNLLDMREIDGVNEQSGPDEEKEGDNNGDEESYQMMEQITPSSLFDTIITGMKFIHVCFEFCDNREEIKALYNKIRIFMNYLDGIGMKLIGKFGSSLNEDKDENGLKLHEDELEEYYLIKHSIEGFNAVGFEDLKSHWSHVRLKDTSSRYLAQSDSFESYKSLNNSLTSEAQWEVITEINKVLKKAQDLVNQDLEQAKKLKSAKVSNKVCKLVEILINRADNELIRSLFEDLDASVKNREVLIQNSVNLLKSGMNLGQTNVGLREVALDRIFREKLRRECIVRLVLITREKVSVDDLVRNLGAVYYGDELADVREVDVYDELCKRKLES